MFCSISSRCRHHFLLPHSLLIHLQFFLNFHTSPPKNPPIFVSTQKDLKSLSNASLHRNSIPKPSISTNSLDFDQTAVLGTLTCYSSDWKRAFEFFNWVESECGFQHTTETFNRMIDVLGKFFEFDLATNLIERMRKNQSTMPDHTTFRIMFKRYVSAHLVNEAISLYDKLEEFELKDELSFSNLIDALCEYKHVIEAEELCLGKGKRNTKNLGFNLSTKFYNMILRGWFKIGWWAKCREFWGEMDRMGVHKDLHSYSIYMDIQGKSGKPWKAVKLYKEMKRKRIKLDVVAYNTVLRAIGLCDGVDVAVRLSREMMELGVEPNVVTYNIILKFLCENGRVREAHKVLDKMYKRGCAPNVLTYHCFFGCLEKPREILELFDQMIGSGVCPTMDTYVMLMRKFGRWGFLRPVFVVWKKMKEQGLAPNEFAYNALIDALVQKGMVDMARKYDEEMLAKGISAKPRAELGTKLVREESDEV